MNHVFVHPPSYTKQRVVSQKNINISEKDFFAFDAIELAPEKVLKLPSTLPER